MFSPSCSLPHHFGSVVALLFGVCSDKCHFIVSKTINDNTNIFHNLAKFLDLSHGQDTMNGGFHTQKQQQSKKTFINNWTFVKKQTVVVVKSSSVFQVQTRVHSPASMRMVFLWVPQTALEFKLPSVFFLVVVFYCIKFE